MASDADTEAAPEPAPEEPAPEELAPQPEPEPAPEEPEDEDEWPQPPEPVPGVKRVLVTGASGYVGQHLIAALALGGISLDGDGSELKYDIYCAYKNLKTFEEDLAQFLDETTLHPSIVGVHAVPNINFLRPWHTDFIERDCGKVDVIINLGAYSSPEFCEEHADWARVSNVPLDLLLLKAPIVHMSTDQVYKGTKEFYKEDQDRAYPVNMYGKSKLAFEKVLQRDKTMTDKPLLTEREGGGTISFSNICLSLLPEAPQPSVILRSSLILGPPTPFKNGCRKGENATFLQFVEGKLKGSEPTDYYTNEFRSVVHIDDVILTITHFLKKALAGDDAQVKTEVYNLGGSTRASMHDIALEVAKHLGLDASTANGVERPEDAGGVPSPPDTSMNVDKLMKELGVPKMKSLEEIVACSFK